MNTSNPKDTRRLTWAEMEKGIQNRAAKKDPRFSLTGKWKKFVRTERGYKVYAVDGSWVRNNLCWYFGHGGHSLVHEFIPMDEIWVATHHYDEGQIPGEHCRCKRKSPNQKLSSRFFESTITHEIEECGQMKRGMVYWRAHHLALTKEEAAGFLHEPYDDRPKHD